MTELNKIVKNYENKIYPKNWVCSDELVGSIFEITNTNINISGVLENRLIKGDLFLCIGHCGDGMQEYILLKKYSNCVKIYQDTYGIVTLGAYCIKNAKKIKISNKKFNKLKNGECIFLKEYCKKI